MFLDLVSLSDLVSVSDDVSVPDVISVPHVLAVLVFFFSVPDLVSVPVCHLESVISFQLCLYILVRYNA